MKTMTQHLLDSYDPKSLSEDLEKGFQAGLKKDTKVIKSPREKLIKVRTAYGLAKTTPDILTKPESNIKLDKAEKPSYGITLYHYVFRSRVKPRTTLNLCPNAGDCTKVCVIENGHGRRPSTQLAWRWRSDLLAHYAGDFMTLLGYELARATLTHGSILLRPNINSDIQWEKVVPGLVDGSVFGDSVSSYGYTKIPEYLKGNGDVTPYYRVCYSHNENSPGWRTINNYINRGGSVAVVTNRKPKNNITQWNKHTVIDADLTDEWIFNKGVIGDLSAKGKAAALVDKSNFVMKVYK